MRVVKLSCLRMNYKIKMMKKTILLLSIVAISCISFAQRIDIGIKGGLNFSELKIPNISTSHKTGYHLGAYSLLKFGKIGIQQEFILSKQGSKVDLETGIPNTSIFLLSLNFTWLLDLICRPGHSLGF